MNDRFMSEGIPQYKLKDYNGEIITGTFYPNQYKQSVYLIDKVLRSRRHGKKKQYLVSWLGWKSPKYDTWVNEQDLKDIKKSLIRDSFRTRRDSSEGYRCYNTQSTNKIQPDCLF